MVACFLKREHVSEPITTETAVDICSLIERTLFVVTASSSKIFLKGKKLKKVSASPMVRSANITSKVSIKADVDKFQGGLKAFLIC